MQQIFIRFYSLFIVGYLFLKCMLNFDIGQLLENGFYTLIYTTHLPERYYTLQQLCNLNQSLC
jgi:hypothetical protein